MYKIITEHFYGSMVLFDLEEKNLVGKYGSLIIIPNRHETCIYPIENKKVEKAIKYLTQIADNRFKEPSPISRNLYWYKDGIFTVQTVLKTQDSIFFFPTEDFHEMIESIMIGK